MPEDAKEAIGIACAPSARNSVPSVSISKRRSVMERSSESIGAIAAALAKAQIELANPEKSLIAISLRAGGRPQLPLRIFI
jgi:hypothetical protein